MEYRPIITNGIADIQDTISKGYSNVEEVVFDSIEKSAKSIGEIASDGWNRIENRREKMTDSPYDFALIKVDYFYRGSSMGVEFPNLPIDQISRIDYGYSSELVQYCRASLYIADELAGEDFDFVLLVPAVEKGGLLNIVAEELFGVSGYTPFWGAHNNLLGWYTDEASIQKEIQAIREAMRRGEPDYALQYNAKVRRRFGRIEIRENNQ